MTGTRRIAAETTPGAPAGRVVEVRSPGVVLLIGPAGSGKSTFAARQFPASAVISSDAMRAAITGDISDQTANGRVFAAVHRELDRRLGAGNLAVIDATSLTIASRRAIRERAERAGAPVAAIVFALPLEIVLRRNAERLERPVPEAVVRRHAAALERSLAPGVLDGEGYRPLVVLRSPGEVEDLRIVVTEGHGPPGWPPTSTVSRPSRP